MRPALDAEAVALRAKQRGGVSLALCVLGMVLAIMSKAEFDAWGRNTMDAACAMEGEGDPSAVWMIHPQSTPVELHTFESAAEEARIRGCTCADVDEADCGFRDENDDYDGNAVGADAGTVRLAATQVLRVVSIQAIVQLLVICRPSLI